MSWATCAVSSNAMAQSWFFRDTNARIHCKEAGEEFIFREHCFGRNTGDADPLSNRNLLFEVCSECGQCVANIFFDVPKE